MAITLRRVIPCKSGLSHSGIPPLTATVGAEEAEVTKGEGAIGGVIDPDITKPLCPLL
jgi:hypothetical protein